MNTKTKNLYTGLEIAVIGMSCKFPEANNIHEFWDNLEAGRESIKRYSKNELKGKGLSDDKINDPLFVPTVGGVIENPLEFDNSFFGFTSNEAELLDPQIRLLYEEVWSALEDAGCNAHTYNGSIGLFAGASPNLQWELFSMASDTKSDVGEFATKLLNNKDFISTRISYNLNFKGPSVTINTACSTSLVAVHMAARAILTKECDIAIAGGASVNIIDNNGYKYQEGLNISKDGVCRAFDKNASGLVGGDGIGVVVLKKLEKAIEDGDNIYAIIKGSAVNNDGKEKIGFTAPSVTGQSDVIKSALRISQVMPETINYIETHGTGTSLGDPIEFYSLSEAFKGVKNGNCTLGALKNNIGHLDAAAGIAGFIKAVLVLKNRKIPPIINFESPNEKLQLEQSPFKFNKNLVDLCSEPNLLRAGVSSFGIGGSNAHIILEEYLAKNDTPTNVNAHIIPVSAKTPGALKQIKNKLVEKLSSNQHLNLGDIAYTLQEGRLALGFREYYVCTDIIELMRKMGLDTEDINCRINKKVSRNVFMFPGQGSQYYQMGMELYLNSKIFRDYFDKYSYLAKELIGFDFKLFFENNKSDEVDYSSIVETSFAQPLLFIFEYALANYLIDIGIQPHAMIGHSVGEYVAATVSGVFTFQQGIQIIAKRAKLMQSVSRGIMLSVNAPKQEILPLIQSCELDIAAINTAFSCVISGIDNDIDKLEQKLQIKGVSFKRLNTSHAFHSRMMDPILEEFKSYLDEMQFSNPKIPFISNVTGTWIDNEEASSAEYWTQHIRKSVMFHDGLEELKKSEDYTFIEVGPGNVLSNILKQCKIEADQVVNLIKHPLVEKSDYVCFLEGVGKLWAFGQNINWDLLSDHEQHKKLSLPTYPFERKYFKHNGNLQKLLGKERSQISKLDNIFYTSYWKQLIKKGYSPANKSVGSYLIFSDDFGISNRLIRKMNLSPKNFTKVVKGTEYKYDNNIVQLNPECFNDYIKLFDQLVINKLFPTSIFYFWNIDRAGNDINRQLILNYFALLYIVKSLAKNQINNEINFTIITNNLHNVMGNEDTMPIESVILGIVKIVPLEYFNVKCKNVDISISTSKKDEQIGSIISQCQDFSGDPIVAIRGINIWVKDIQPIQVDNLFEERIKPNGTYLITGGTGGMGKEIARFLVKEYKANLILVSRTIDNNVIENLKSIGNQSKIVHYSADVSDFERMKDIVEEVYKSFKRINGVFHAAGIPDFGGVIQRRNNEKSYQVFAPKIIGLRNIEKLLSTEKIDFVVLFSSLSNYLYRGKYGQIAYVSANEYLDAFIHKNDFTGNTFIQTINWEDWNENGMTVKSREIRKHFKEDIDKTYTLNNTEGIKALKNSLFSQFSNVILSKRDLREALNEMSTKFLDIESKTYEEAEKIDINKDFEIRNSINQNSIIELEGTLIQIWKKFFGIENINKKSDFFDLGGDSLQMVSLVSNIHKHLNVKIPISIFFEHSTISEIAKYIYKSHKNTCLKIKYAEKKDYYRTTSQQQRIFFMQQMGLDSTNFNQVFAFITKGELNIEKFENALLKLTKMQPALRSSFHIIKNEIVQKIHKDINYNIQYNDLSSRNISSDNFDNINLVIKDFCKPFDLGTPPLFKIEIYKLNIDENLIIMDLHHIISDGESNNLFINQLINIYEKKDVKVLLNYIDYSEWVNSKETQDRLENQKKFWLQFLENTNGQENYYNFSNKTSILEETASRSITCLNKELSQKIGDIIHLLGSTQNIYFLSIFYILIAKYTKKRDIIIGINISGRTISELDQTIGVFTNLLPIRHLMINNISFKEFHNSLRGNLIQAYENQEYQFNDIIQNLNIKKNYGTNPLFDTLFIMLDEISLTKNTKTSDGLEMIPLNRELDTSRFNFVLFCQKQADGKFQLKLEYLRYIFTDEEANYFLDQYVNIVTKVEENINIRLTDLLDSNQEAQLIGPSINFNFN